MFKKVLVAVSVVILSAGYAQAQISFGVRAGLNLTNMKMSYSEESIDGKMKSGIQLGVVSEIEITKFLSIQPGLLFAQQGYKNEIPAGVTGVYYKQTVTLNYIQIPVNAICKLYFGTVTLLGQAGPYIGYGINGKIKTKIPEEQRTISFGSEDNDYMKALDFGFGFGTGVQSGPFQAGISYNIGLTKIAKTTDFSGGCVIGLPRSKEKAKNNGFVITLIYLFGK